MRTASLGTAAPSQTCTRRFQRTVQALIKGEARNLNPGNAVMRGCAEAAVAQAKPQEHALIAEQ
jgi:hypothetical protein